MENAFTAAPDQGLLEFVRGASPDAKTRARIADAVPAEFFAVPGGLTARERQELTYRRLRHAGLPAPPAAAPLDGPPGLCAQLDRAASADRARSRVHAQHDT